MPTGAEEWLLAHLRQNLGEININVDTLKCGQKVRGVLSSKYKVDINDHTACQRYKPQSLFVYVNVQKLVNVKIFYLNDPTYKWVSIQLIMTPWEIDNTIDIRD